MDQASVRNVSLFFFLFLLDSSAALNLAQIAKKKLDDLFQKNETLDRNRFFVSVTNELIRRRNYSLRTGFQDIKDSGIILPPELNIQPWQEFRKRAAGDEVAMVLWALVFKIPQSEIAAVLQISEGTVKYRLSKAVIQLGQVVKNA